MNRKILTVVKLQLWGNQTTPAPPVGPALGQYGVNIGQFCQQFNCRTEKQAGNVLPVEVTIYDDKSFTFIVKQPTTVCLLKEIAEIDRGSGRPNTEKVGFITLDQLNEVARIKMTDLNTSSLEAAARTIAGTARSMGIEIRQ